MKQITSQNIVKGFQAGEHRYSFLEQEFNTYPQAVHVPISSANPWAATTWVQDDFETSCKLNFVSS